ncbi:hypothetical protein BVRB_033020, partial [Beta vulgaris subsp. vulgaris]
ISWQVSYHCVFIHQTSPHLKITNTPIPHKGQPPTILDDTDLPPSTGPAEDISLEPEPLPRVTSEGSNGFPL